MAEGLTRVCHILPRIPRTAEGTDVVPTTNWPVSRESCCWKALAQDAGLHAVMFLR